MSQYGLSLAWLNMLMFMVICIFLDWFERFLPFNDQESRCCWKADHPEYLFDLY